MRILAIETTGRCGSLAALIGDANDARCTNEVRLDGQARTAQTLAPALQAMLDKMAWPPPSIDLVAVATGPGSFTGLRIGVTTAKTLAYAAGSEIIGVDTMSVLAAQLHPSARPLWTILDAQRQELFVARFESNDALPSSSATVSPAISILAQQRWLDELRPGDHVTGPPLGRIRPLLPEGIIAAADDAWQPTAAAVGHVAWRANQSGRRDDVWQLVPQYHRASAAEEKTRRQGDREARR